MRVISITFPIELPLVKIGKRKCGYRDHQIWSCSVSWAKFGLDQLESEDDGVCTDQGRRNRGTERGWGAIIFRQIN